MAEGAVTIYTLVILILLGRGIGLTQVIAYTIGLFLRAATNAFTLRISCAGPLK